MPFLPIQRRGDERLDVVLVTGDAYVDHPSFGAALIGRVLEAAGFSVGILAQPDWRTAEPFRAFGEPRLFFGVTGGNLDSMVANFTAEKRRRRDDAFTPGGRAGRRPDRALIVYAQRCREAFPKTPIILGGLEASLRRVAHYDFWEDRVRRSILLDAKADLLVYGPGERAVVAIAKRIAAADPVDDVPGTAFVATDPEAIARRLARPTIELPALEDVAADPKAFALASKRLRAEQNPDSGAVLVQRHAGRAVVILPPAAPLTTPEFDALYALPFERAPHPSIQDEHLPAWEQIRHSITIIRGCCCGCAFCSLTEHQGSRLVSRSKASILAELSTLATSPGFRGTVTDLGGPTANLWQMGCRDAEAQAACRRPSCVHPTRCPRLDLDHGPLVDLYRAARKVPGIRHLFIASGVRYDLAELDDAHGDAYVKELVTHHVSGHLKVAPEHVSPRVLKRMRKPSLATFERFRRRFDALSREAGKEQYLVPYFISSHPGSGLAEAKELHDYLKRNRWKPRQVQDFMPTPMTLATDMFHTGLDPATLEPVEVAKTPAEKREQRALLGWSDPTFDADRRRALRKLEQIGDGAVRTPTSRFVPPARR